MGKPNQIGLPLDKTLWAKVIAKATAKFWGEGYRAHTGGREKELFNVLSNMPTTSMNHRDMDMEEHWKLLTEADRKH